MRRWKQLMRPQDVGKGASKDISKPVVRKGFCGNSPTKRASSKSRICKKCIHQSEIENLKSENIILWVNVSEGCAPFRPRLVRAQNLAC